MMFGLLSSTAVTIVEVRILYERVTPVSAEAR